MTARVSRTLRLLLVLAIALGLAIITSAVTAPRADAHDVLVSTSPADGSTVATVPAEVTLTFDQPALAIGTRLKIVGPSGEVQQGKPQLVDQTVSQALRPDLPAGRYTVTWRATSKDGHPISGTFGFTAARTGATPASSATPRSASTTSPSSTMAPSAAASPTATPTAAPTATPSTAAAAGESSGSALAWVLGASAAVLVLGAGAAIWRAGRPE